jgi:radical SAM superfamily enzyme YgiQ (UPF0313 family)
MEGMGFGWVTFTRADVVDEEVLTAWRRAGCHTLMFGVEFADPEMHRRTRKGYRPPRVAEGLAVARRVGIRTVGTFLLGLPEETVASIAATVDLACALPLDFASFNVAVPRHGTPLRLQAIAAGLTDAETVMDQAGATIAMPTTTLSREEVATWRRRAVTRFYGRPRYLLRRLRQVDSLYELGAELTEALSLLARTVGA